MPPAHPGWKAFSSIAALMHQPMFIHFVNIQFLAKAGGLQRQRGAMKCDDDQQLTFSRIKFFGKN